MADYISCIEASGGNKQEISEEVSALSGKQTGGAASASGGNKIIKGSAGLALDQKAESALVKKLEGKWFSGGMSECAKVLNATPLKKVDSKLEIVDYAVSYPENQDILIPQIDLKLRNIGDQVAFVKELRLDVLGEATFEDCRQPRYSLVMASATYEINILGERSKLISHEIKPKEVDRIIVSVGRDKGGPTFTVYKVQLSVLYDGDGKKASSKPFFLKLSGPTTPEGMFIAGVTEEVWKQCVVRNTEKFGKIGYQVYKEK